RMTPATKCLKARFTSAWVGKTSTWSCSTFVTIAISGSSERKAWSYSSASITRKSPRPAYAFVPRSRSTAPQMSDGSRPPARRAAPARVATSPCPIRSPDPREPGADARRRTCPCRRCRRYGISSCTVAELAKLVRDRRRRIGTPRGSRGLRHAREAGRIVEEPGDLSDEPIGIELALADHDGRTALRDVLRVGHLVRLRRGGERNEDEWDAERERFRDGGAARPSDDEIRRRERGAHLLAKEPEHLIPLPKIGRQRLPLCRDLREMGVAGVMDHDR